MTQIFLILIGTAVVVILLSRKGREKVVGICAVALDQQFTGTNSEIVQGASALGVGVEKLYDSALKNKQNLILDGTFAAYDKSFSNVQRSLKRGRVVEIFYLYQDPRIAWDFTKKREELV